MSGFYRPTTRRTRIRFPNNLFECTQVIALLIDQELRITDDVDEKDMRDLQAHFCFLLIRHTRLRHVAPLQPCEKIDPFIFSRSKPYSVCYDQVNAMLLNEFLKEHKTVQEQEAIIARQQKQIEALSAGLQKVSAQLEASKPAPQTALNNR